MIGQHVNIILAVLGVLLASLCFGFPGPKVHRLNRRKLGRGQFPAAQGVTCVVTGTGSTVTLTFARPVVVTGPIPLTVATRTLTTQTVVSPTVVTQLMSGTLTGNAWNLPSGADNVRTQQGGAVSGASGTF